MRTFSTRRPRNSPPGDYAALCHGCSALYLRSRMQKDSSGRLFCRTPGCMDRKDETALAEEIAQAASRPRVTWAPKDGGRPDEEDP